MQGKNTFPFLSTLWLTWSGWNIIATARAGPWVCSLTNRFHAILSLFWNLMSHKIPDGTKSKLNLLPVDLLFCLLLAAEKNNLFYTRTDGKVMETECNYPRAELCLTPFTLTTSILARTKHMYLEVHSDLRHCSPLSLEWSFLDWQLVDYQVHALLTRHRTLLGGEYGHLVSSRKYLPLCPVLLQLS